MSIGSDFKKQKRSLRQEAIAFAAEMVYRALNPKSKMDVPSMAYEMMERKYDKWEDKTK